mmetsp:Transcript_23205/g.55941  ORF Transcript_23205/g.55941 Transcript_23205/m.55941 type:complete len:82 (+) Transcript_23205:3662-3907(+)
MTLYPMHDRKLPVTLAGMKPTIEVSLNLPSAKNVAPVIAVAIQIETSTVGRSFSRLSGAQEEVPPGQRDEEICLAISVMKT